MSNFNRILEKITKNSVRYFMGVSEKTYEKYKVEGIPVGSYLTADYSEASKRYNIVIELINLQDLSKNYKFKGLGSGDLIEIVKPIDAKHIKKLRKK